MTLTSTDDFGFVNNETTDISNEWTSENSNTKDDGDRKPPRGQDLARGKEEVDVGEENPKMEEVIHRRKSERVHRQRYSIHPDDIGNNDDKSDQDYVLKG